MGRGGRKPPVVGEYPSRLAASKAWGGGRNRGSPIMCWSIATTSSPSLKPRALWHRLGDGKGRRMAELSQPRRTLDADLRQTGYLARSFCCDPVRRQGCSHPSRHYQDIAVGRVSEAIAAGKPRNNSCTKKHDLSTDFPTGCSPAIRLRSGRAAGRSPARRRCAARTADWCGARRSARRTGDSHPRW